MLASLVTYIISVTAEYISFIIWHQMAASCLTLGGIVDKIATHSNLSTFMLALWFLWLC